MELTDMYSGNLFGWGADRNLYSDSSFAIQRQAVEKVLNSIVCVFFVIAVIKTIEIL